MDKTILRDNVYLLGDACKSNSLKEYISGLSDVSYKIVAEIINKIAAIDLKEDFDASKIDEETVERFETIMNTAQSEVTLCAIENLYTEKYNNMTYLEKLYHAITDAYLELHPGFGTGLSNNLLINVTTSNKGVFFLNVTNEYANEDEDDNTTGTEYFRKISNTHIETLTSFAKLVNDELNSEMVALEPSQINKVKSDVISILTEDATDEMEISFNVNKCKMIVKIDDVEISPCLLGEAYTRYKMNLKEIKEEYGYSMLNSYEARNKLGEGISYDEIADYLIATGEFGEDDFYAEEEATAQLTLEPASLVMTMKGLKPFPKPIGVLFKNSGNGGVKECGMYFIPIVQTKNSLSNDRVKVSAVDNVVMDFPKMQGCQILNPAMLKLCKEKPIILSNVQIDSMQYQEIINALNNHKSVGGKVGQLIDSSEQRETVEMLRKMMGV